MLLGDMRRAVAGQTDVILFNIDSKADSGNDRDAILQVFLRVFNEMQGLSGDAPHVADMERHLMAKGAFETFKAAFQASNGSTWEAERDAVDFLRDDVIAGLSQALGMSPDSAGKWFDDARERYTINIETFASLVNQYLQAKGPQQRVVFLVDEVGQFIGKNTQLMLNLQTITEELGLKCKGRAWVIVTSQEDIDATLGDDNQARSNDFSKITARFHTRLSLSAPTPTKSLPTACWKNPRRPRRTASHLGRQRRHHQQPALVCRPRHRLQVHPERRRLRHPLSLCALPVPAAAKVFESIRKVGATGRHLAKGERSMLDAFQTAAVHNGQRSTQALVPLYDFYPSIESFLDSSVKRAIDQASDNPGLQPWDLKLLRALFLIRYADAVKGSVDTWPPCAWMRLMPTNSP